MLKIKQILSALLEKHPRHLFFNTLTSELAYGTNADADAFENGELYNDPDAYWHMLPSYPKEYYEDFKIEFSKEHGIDPSTKSFKQTVKKKGLWEAWVDFVLEKDITRLADLEFTLDLKDEEALKEDYLEIRKLLEEYESKEFETRYSDLAFFAMKKGLHISDFFIMGNSKQTYGISFYRGELSLSNVYSFLDSLDSEEYRPELPALSSFISIYLNKDSNTENEIPINPLGDDLRYSSISVNIGRRALNYFTKTMARCIKCQLREVIDALTALDKKGGVDSNKPLNVMLSYREGKWISNVVTRTKAMLHSVDTYIEDLFIPYASPDITPSKTKGHDYAFTFRQLPNANFDIDENDPRLGFVGFVAFVVDCNLGIIVGAMTPQLESDEPLGVSLRYVAKKYLDGIPAAKNIYVNNLVDYYMADFLLSPILGAKSNIYFTEETLPTDDAFEEFVNFLPPDAFGGPAKA